jgi:hypothetical protein
VITDVGVTERLDRAVGAVLTSAELA